MGIVQPYRSRLIVDNLGPNGGTTLPIVLGATSLDWPDMLRPLFPAGNYWTFNYQDGPQQPALNVGFGLLDGNQHNCPLSVMLMRPWFLDRTTDYTHDSIAIDNVAIYDGFSGFRFAEVKWDSFSLFGEKGRILSLQATALPQFPDGTDSVQFIGAGQLAESFGFGGAPISFQGLSFFKNLTYSTIGYNLGGNWTFLNGVNRFHVQYSNNHSPDLTMVPRETKDAYLNYVSSLPVALCAGPKTVVASIRIQSHDESVISDGDSLHFCVRQGQIATMVSLPNVVVTNRRDRTVGVGRQFRDYSIIGFADDVNGLPPLTVSPVISIA